MDSIVRPTNINYTRGTIIERLSTHETPHEPSQCTEPTLAGATFSRYFSLSSGSGWSNFGMNGQAAVVLLPSKALKSVIVALKQK